MYLLNLLKQIFFSDLQNLPTLGPACFGCQPYLIIDLYQPGPHSLLPHCFANYRVTLVDGETNLVVSNCIKKERRRKEKN